MPATNARHRHGRASDDLRVSTVARATDVNHAFGILAAAEAVLSGHPPLLLAGQRSNRLLCLPCPDGHSRVRGQGTLVLDFDTRRTMACACGEPQAWISWRWQLFYPLRTYLLRQAIRLGLRQWTTEA